MLSSFFRRSAPDIAKNTGTANLQNIEINKYTQNGKLPISRLENKKNPFEAV